MKYNSVPEELSDELILLQERARKINYKNQIPRLPKPQYSQKSFDNLMIGFQKRLTNWEKGLIQLENPGGTLNGKKRVDFSYNGESDGFDSPYDIMKLLETN